MCCDSWGHKESDMTERQNSSELKHWRDSELSPQAFCLLYILALLGDSNLMAFHTIW